MVVTFEATVSMRQWFSLFLRPHFSNRPGNEANSARVHKNNATGVRACNYIKIETGRNFPPVLKIVTRTVQAA